MAWQDVEVTARQLRRRPNFTEAVLTHTSGIMVFRRNQRGVMKLLAKEERYRAFNIFICMCYSAALRGADGVTFTQFYNACTQQAGLSDRTTRTVLQLSDHYGFVVIGRDDRDRRIRLYKPTEKLRSYATDWLAPSVDALRLLEFRAPPLPHQERIPRTFASCFGDYLDGSLRFFQHDPDCQRVFAALEGGALISMAAIESHLRGSAPPSRREIAGAYGLSRAQVSRVLEEGNNIDMFAEGSGVIPSERLLAFYTHSVSLVLAFLAFHEAQGAAAALRDRQQIIRAPLGSALIPALEMHPQSAGDERAG